MGSANHGDVDLEPKLRIICIPATDADLCGVVQRLYNSIRSVTPGRLQDALREAYPRAVVGRLELPDEPMPVWMVYRDGTDPAEPSQSRVS